MDESQSVFLRTGERVEVLDGEYRIIQNPNLYLFGSDAVRLAKYAVKHIKPNARVADLCSGSGVVGLLAAIYIDCSVDGAELDRELWDMSERSVALNGLSRRVRFYNVDVRDLSGSPIARHGYDAVVCNPPYYNYGKTRNKSANATCELTVTLEQVIAAAAYALKPRGELFLTHICRRLDSVLYEARKSGFAAKELILQKSRKTFLLRCVLGGGDGMTVSREDF